MTESLAGRVALVTGGSGGIGRALVSRLAAAGSHVAIGYQKRRDAAETAAEDARSAGVRAVTFQADLTDPASALGAVERVEEDLGPIDILLPNAGLGVQADLDRVDTDLWRRTHAVNLESPFVLARRLTPPMAERGWGRVLFTSSVAAYTGGLVGPHYASSKAGLQGLVGWFARHFADRGVTVNAIAPALIGDTAMLPTGPDDKAPTPVGRYGRPEEIADLAMAMLANGYLTGKTYLVDGGMYPR